MFQDFKELLSAFNAHQVRYLIVGGYAVSFHAEPRATKDLDVLISADAENSRAVYAALAKFGAPVEGLKAKDFTEPGNFFRMGTPPVMVDIMPKISGVEFEDAWARRVNVAIDDTLTAPFISRQDLLAAKLSAGRPQDLADVAALGDIEDHRETDQQQSASSGSTALEQMREMQRKGREDWLKRRQQQIEGSSPTPEQIRAKGREDWLKSRKQQSENPPSPVGDTTAKDRARDIDPKDREKDPGRGIEDDLGL
jgi:Nucleotidyltransferase of unknown function (DUF6036)